MLLMVSSFMLLVLINDVTDVVVLSFLVVLVLLC